jgi:hypothetical protein
MHHTGFGIRCQRSKKMAKDGALDTALEHKKPGQDRIGKRVGGRQLTKVSCFSRFRDMVWKVKAEVQLRGDRVEFQEE